MNPKPNISLVNALIRITCGFTFLAWSTAKLSKKPHNQSYLLIALLAGMKIAEGIVRYCPIVALYDKKDVMMPKGQNLRSQENHSEQHNHKSNNPESQTHEVKTTSSPEIANIMEQFSPEKIFSADDMKK